MCSLATGLRVQLRAVMERPAEPRTYAQIGLTLVGIGDKRAVRTALRRSLASSRIGTKAYPCVDVPFAKQRSGKPMSFRAGLAHLRHRWSRQHPSIACHSLHRSYDRFGLVHPCMSELNRTGVLGGSRAVSQLHSGQTAGQRIICGMDDRAPAPGVRQPVKCQSPTEWATRWQLQCKAQYPLQPGNCSVDQLIEPKLRAAFGRVMRTVLSQLMLALRVDLSKALSKVVVDGPDRVIDGRPVRLTHGKQLAGGVGLKMYRAVLGGTMAGVPHQLLWVLHGLPLCSRLYDLVLCPSVCLSQVCMHM